MLKLLDDSPCNFNVRLPRADVLEDLVDRPFVLEHHVYNAHDNSGAFVVLRDDQTGLEILDSLFDKFVNFHQKTHVEQIIYTMLRPVADGVVLNLTDQRTIYLFVLLQFCPHLSVVELERVV